MSVSQGVAVVESPEDVKRRLEEASETNIATGCWSLPGEIELLGRKVDARRASYFVYIGTIGSSKRIVTTCGNHDCINPDHLRAFASEH
ncbi:hypothetical protein Pan189_41740 [Stratiformator vulcanicus]|uniref:HNH nuclease domain-containing protein n=1 Tax=Stratiformator vulcanicus TaxID=2527980 RepID=A0A517R792_9PLAN|nr:hypothetical protein Pan189_41740 [Stratiformator vulcanicus]